MSSVPPDERLTNSPLKDVNPKSLDDLYDEDPLNLTDNDLMRLVKDLREKRALWAAEEKIAATKGTRTKKVYKEVPKSGISLGDLGLIPPKAD